MHSFVPALFAATLATFASAAPISAPVTLPANVPSLPLPDNLPSVSLRAATLSVSAIFADVVTEIQPFIEQLTYLTPSNCTVTEVTSVVSSIKAPIVTAIGQLKALVGQEASVILAPVDSTVSGAQLTVSQIAGIVGADVKLVLGAAGQVVSIVKVQGGSIVTDVDDVLADLGTTVTELVIVVDGLVDGLATSLATVLAPVKTIIYELGLDDLAASLCL